MAKKREFENNKNIDFGYIDEVIKANNLSWSHASESLGKNKSYLSSCKAENGSKLDATTIKLFCALYKADEKKIYKQEKPVATQGAIPESVATALADIMGKLSEMSTQIDTLKARMDRPVDPTDFNILSNKEKATVILKAMQYENGAVDTVDYENKLKEFNVPYECIKQAMAATSSQFITKQYGNKKIKWIVII